MMFYKETSQLQTPPFEAVTFIGVWYARVPLDIYLFRKARNTHANWPLFYMYLGNFKVYLNWFYHHISNLAFNKSTWKNNCEKGRFFCYLHEIHYKVL